MRVTDEGRPIIYSFAGDNYRTCLAHLGIEVGDAQKQDRAAWDKMRRERADAQRRADAESQTFCERVWSQTVPIEGTPAEAYLFNRGLILEGSPVVRFHEAAPRSKRPEGSTPPPPKAAAAMVAIAQDADGRPRGLHCTYLSADGRKAFANGSRLMFGRLAGCAVRLAPMPADGVLALAEGVENAGAYTLLHGTPCWSALSTSGLQGFVLPGGVRRLIIAADGDDAGAVAAANLAERVGRACAVTIDAAPSGRDWNDVLMGGEHG